VWLAVATELVLDKLPSAPSRLEPRGLSARIVFGAVAGAVLARGADRSVPAAMVVSSAAALIGARLGHDLRTAAAERLPAIPVAIAEDVLALALGVSSAH
jgi:uncharacterized membrane protein